MKRKPIPRRLSYMAASRAFDSIGHAQADLEGTFAVFSRLLDGAAVEDIDGFMLTMDRHLKADLEALKAAIDKARSAILRPLREADLPGVESMAIGDALAAVAAAEAADQAGASSIKLVVDNGGGGDAAA